MTTATIPQVSNAEPGFAPVEAFDVESGQMMMCHTPEERKNLIHKYLASVGIDTSRSEADALAMSEFMLRREGFQKQAAEVTKEVNKRMSYIIWQTAQIELANAEIERVSEGLIEYKGKLAKLYHYNDHVKALWERYKRSGSDEQAAILIELRLPTDVD